MESLTRRTKIGMSGDDVTMPGTFAPGTPISLPGSEPNLADR
jgi:hypothetical protein